MPLVDMPLNELCTYDGRNPCPPDMDEYWEKALAEMKSTDPKVELIPATFTVPFAECFDLYFTGVRGARIHALYLRPKPAPGLGQNKPHPAVLAFHGYSGNAGDWSSRLNYVALGFSVAALDCRGQGGLSEDAGGVKGNTFHGHIIRGLNDRPENLLFRQIFLDTAQLANIVMAMPEVDPDRVGAIGESQGGGLALACGSLEPRIKRLVTGFPFLCDYKRVWEMDLALEAYEELKLFFRQFDPRHEREGEIFMRLGYIDVQHLAKRIQGRVLWGLGLADKICPPSTQFSAYNKIRCPKHMMIYPDFGHEHLPGFYDQAFQFLSEL